MNGTAARPSRSRRAHGLHVSRIDGTPLIYNMEDVYMPDLLIARIDDARAVLDLLTEMATA